MYLIVVGAGDIGSPLVEIASMAGNEVVVVERDSEKAKAVAAECDCLVINDDATAMDTLEEAGADRADALISTTDQDATNIMTSLLAKELDVPAVVSVVHNPEHMDVFREIGVNTMENPSRLIADHLFRAVQRPTIVDYMRVGETAEVFEITVTESAPIANKQLSEAAEEDIVPDDTLVVAIARDESDPLTPRGDTTIHPGDVVTVYSTRGITPDVTDVFGHYEDQTERYQRQ